jgi:hypothetical protein
MQYAFYLDGRNCGTFDRRKQNPAQRVTDRCAETPFEGLGVETSIREVQGFRITEKSFGSLKTCH